MQERLQHNLAFSKRNSKHEYLLRGRVTCAETGLSYTGSCQKLTIRGEAISRRLFRLYPRPAHPGVRGGQLRADEVEAAVWEYVRGVLEHPERIVTEMEAQRVTQGETDYERDVKTLRDQLNKLAVKERKLLALALSIEEDDEATAMFQREQAGIKGAARPLPRGSGTT